MSVFSKIGNALGISGRSESELAQEDAARQLGEGGYDQQAYDRYVQEGDPQIDQGMYQASRAAAQAYNRRGMGKSGAAVGAAVEDPAMRAAVQRKNLRLNAIDRATEIRRRRLLDKMGAYGQVTKNNNANDMFGYGLLKDAAGGAGQIYGMATAAPTPAGSEGMPFADIRDEEGWWD